MIKNVIWGTGYYASLFALKLGRDNISFFIDSDSKRSGRFLGKKVVTPDKISVWTNMHIYVPYNYYDEIACFLNEKGLSENVDFSRYNEVVSFTKEEAERDFIRACNEVDKLSNKYSDFSTAWCGRFWATKREYRDCIEILKKGGSKLVLLADTPWYKQEEIECEIHCAVVVMPLVMHDFVLIEAADDEYDIDEKDSSFNAIMCLTENFMVREKNVMGSGAKYKAKRSADFMDYLLNKHEFKHFIVGGSDRGISKLIKDKCIKKGISPLFTHQGVIPGTLMMGPGGDMGDSVPSVYYKQFRLLPVDEKHISNAQLVCDYLYYSRANRKVQPQNDAVEKIKKNTCDAKPTVLCLGQNDLDSTLIPYTEESKKYQSPVFKTSIESVLFLADICKKNNWNIIYKPHPMYAEFEDYESLPKNVSVVPYADINEMIDIADLVVTIRSSSNYVALIRQKPVLMLGYTQTRGQGCTYEAFSKEEIEPQLNTALRNGFTQEQRRAFFEHIARLLRYYLYDDMSERPIRYGLPFSSCVDEFFLLEKRLKSMVNE